MDDAQIYALLEQVFEDVFGQDSIKISPGLSAVAIDRSDSLTFLRLIISVERTFKIKFSTVEIDRLERVDDLLAVIESRA